MRIKFILFVIVLLIMVLCEPVNVFACGPFFTAVNFVETDKPGNPPQQFIKGNIGILLPTFNERYLNLAYSHLIDYKFTLQEQDSILKAWESPVEERNNEQETTALALWKQARYLADGANQFYPMIDQGYFGEIRPGEYASYLNISDDALIHASETLTKMVQKFGGHHPAVIDWRNAQDRVFEIANKGGIPPEICDASFPVEFQYDRFYQIASAYFYLRNFDLAKKAFTELSLDPKNQLAKLCRFMVGRTLIRKGTLASSDWGVFDTTILVNAHLFLHEIIRDTAMKEFEPSSKRLLGFLNLRLYPDSVMHELEERFLTCSEQELLSHVNKPSQEFIDYDYVYSGRRQEHSRRHLIEKRIEIAERNNARRNEKLDWIWCFKSSDSIDFIHSVQQWLNSKNPDAWLVSVISKIDAHHSLLKKVLEHAAKIPPQSPAYAIVNFHKIRLLIDIGKMDEARRYSDTVLRNIGDVLPNASTNLLLSQRLTMAQSLDEVFLFSQQSPANFEYPEISERSTNYERYRFFIYGFSIINKMIPTEILANVVRKNLFQQNLAAEAAMAVWVRAVLLGQDSIALTIAPILESRFPELKKEFQNYSTTADSSSRHFQGMYIIMKHPGTSPLLREGYGRNTPIATIDDLRDNWWGEEDMRIKEDDDNSLSQLIQKFLTKREKKIAEKEHKILSEKIPAFSLFTAEAVRWALLHRTDPRSPEVLYLAIRSSRYSKDETSKVNNTKAAFDLLHKYYSESLWAKKAPYWF